MTFISCNNPVLSKAVLYQDEDITGTVYKHVYISRILEDKREVFVWLPTNYQKNTRYPLLVLHDGQNVFFPGASVSGNEWHLDESATDLLKSNNMNPIIMVGVGNTKNRTVDYSPHLGGANYGKALASELIPILKTKYSINDNKIGTMGASYGGLISLFLGWEMGSTFSMVACLSPAFQYKDFNYIDSIKNQDLPKRLKIAVVNGTKDLDAELQPGVNKFIDMLKQKEFPNDDLMYWIADGKSHTELDWANQAKLILPWFFGFKK